MLTKIALRYVYNAILTPTSFPGSIFSSSLGRWKKDPGCDWSRDLLLHKFFHGGRGNEQLLTISTETKESRSLEIACFNHTQTHLWNSPVNGLHLQFNAAYWSITLISCLAGRITKKLNYLSVYFKNFTKDKNLSVDKREEMSCPCSMLTIQC